MFGRTGFWGAVYKKIRDTVVQSNMSVRDLESIYIDRWLSNTKNNSRVMPANLIMKKYDCVFAHHGKDEGWELVCDMV
jgi:hypothetical protein